MPMSGHAKRLLDEALSLPDEERADLAAELLASLTPPDRRTSAEWVAEVERRGRAALTGEAGVAWDEARRQIENRLRNR